ncbi:hypothetical protein L1987_48506 [Smallanthus sonchifolius]|uniref:Uncharacterized protein n=1 Tax=Smallanthus sonchifolius TaxID=185202 RepID=A0ACB9FT89_9ASTR|nr:hypothetical protein L1987_48506 [Smallanthus sonchifolius]
MARAFTNEFNLLANTQPEWKGAALQYREIVDFLNRSRISYAISADPTVSRPYLEQFWETAEHDCTVSPNVIRATLAGQAIAFSEDTIRRVLQFRDLATDPTAYPDYYVDGCWRQRMGYVGARDYASYNKMGYNFSRYIFKAINGQINTAEKFRLILYPRFVQLLIDDALPNLPAIGERLQVKRVDKRVFAQFLKSGSVEPTPVHTELFGHLINEAYVAPDDWNWYSHNSEPEQSEHSDEQQQEEMESDDGSSEDRDDEGDDGVTEEVPATVTFPTTSVQVAVTTPIVTESVTITPTITPTTLVTSSIPTTTTEPLSQPFNYGDFTQGFDFDTIFSSPTHNAEASSSRHPDPNDARIDINSLIDEVTILRSQRTGTEERLKNVLAQNELLIKINEMLLGHGSSMELRFDAQRKEHELMVKLIADLTKKLDAPGEKDKEKEKEKEKRTTISDEECHPVDLTKDDDNDKDPEAGPSGDEHQALAIVPISAVPMAKGESTHQEGGDTSGGGEIDSGDDWDDDDENVVIKIPKGDGEGEYELENGEIFEFPSFDAPLDTGSVEQASNVEASTEASPVDPEPVDPEAPKETDMPSTSTKGPAPVWQKTSIIDKHGATGMILAVRFEEDKQLFAIKRSGGVQYLKPTSEAFSSLPKYYLVNLANRELLGHSNHAVAMGLWVVLQREARLGKFKIFKPQVPKRVKDKHAVHPVTKKHLKKLVYKPVRCETKIPMSKLSQDILGDMWYWYVDPKTGEAVIMGKGRSESGNLVPKELIRIFDEVCFINFSVEDLEVLAEHYRVYTDE